MFNNLLKNGSVRIWDLPVRLFHWLLVILVVTCFVSIQMKKVVLHQYAGIGILVLIVFRIIWGLVGSSTARFSDFIPSISTIFYYLKTKRSPTEGHNPLGALMVFALIFALLLQTVTGLFLEDNSYVQDAPLANTVTSKIRSVMLLIHKIDASVLIGLVILHILASLFYLIVKKRNLIGTMITGRRKVSELHTPAFELRKDRPFLALFIFLIIAVAAYLAFFYPQTSKAFISWLKALLR